MMLRIANTKLTADVVEEAVAWLAGCCPTDGTQHTVSTLERISSDTIRGVAATLGEYGQRGAARRWAEIVLARERQNGESADLTGNPSSPEAAAGMTSVADAPLHVFAAAIDALADLGQIDIARRAVALRRWRQTRRGEVLDVGDAAASSPLTTALMARVWFRLGQRDRGNRAIAWLAGRWKSATGFCDPSQHDQQNGPSEAGIRTCKCFLDAVTWQVRTLFDENVQELPDEIDAADERWQAVLRWANALPPDARLVDAGCGTGRFLKQLAAVYPRLSLAGVDVSPVALSQVPGGVDARVGSMLRIPHLDGVFDAALAVESLEHSLLPETALTELCRIVRPGGRLMVIDKNCRRQALSVHEPWERWFTADELAGWLQRHCDQVEVAEIAHGANHRPDGLFLAWTARRKRP